MGEWAPLRRSDKSTGSLRDCPACQPLCFFIFFILSLPLSAESLYARFTFGPLSGKRQMTQDARRLYCLTKAAELRIFDKLAIRSRMKDIGEPPAPVGKLKLKGVPETLDWTGPKTLCIGTGNHLVLVDVSNPKSPKLLSETQIAKRELDGTSEVRRIGKYLFAAARKQGLLRFDISDPRRLVPAGSIRLKGFAYSMDVFKGIAAVATGAGISFVDITGDRLSLNSDFDTLRHTEIVRYIDNHLITCSKHYTTIWSLEEDPFAPEWKASLSTFDPFYFTHLCALYVTPDYLYVSGGEGGLYLHDWRNPSQPQTIVQYSFWGTKNRFTPEKKIEYVKAMGLAKNDKQAMRFISPNETNYIISMGMAVEPPYVYMLDMNDKLWVLEVNIGPKPSARCVVRPPG